MKTQKQINEIRKTLMNGNCIFTVKGIDTYQETNIGTYGYSLQHLKISKDSTYISEVNTIGMGGSMNIRKFTKNTIHLFSYSILHNEVKGKINLQHVTILEVL